MKHILFAPVFLFSTLCIAQQSPAILFDGTGKIRPTLPEKLFKEDKVAFKVNDPKESFDKYTKSFKDKLKQAKELLSKLQADAEKMDVLEKVFDIKAADISTVIGEVNQVLNNPSLAAAPTYVPGFTAPDKKYFTIAVENTAAPGTKTFAPNTVSDLFPVAPNGTETQLYFTLAKDDPFKKLAYNWLQHTKADYSGTLNPLPLLQFKKDIASKTESINKFIASIQPLIEKGKAGNIKASDIPALNAIIGQCDSYVSEVESLIAAKSSLIKLPQFKKWILEWLWYQRNMLPAINPLGFNAEGNIGNRPDTSMLAGLRIKLQARDEFFKSTDLKKLRVSQIDSMLNEMDSLKKNLYDIQVASKQFDEMKAGNEKAALAFRTTSQELNKGILFVGEQKKAIYWMRHHNAAENYQLMNDLESGEYLENDRVIILSHNLKLNEKTELHLSFQDITADASLLTDALMPVITQLASMIGIAGAPQKIESDAIKELLIKVQGKISKLKSRLEDLQPYNKCLDYLLAQSNPPLDLEEYTDKALAYHSEVVNPMKKTEGPKKATYYMNTALINKNSADSASINKIAADTFSYRINKLYRIFPMAGVTWASNKFNDVVFDTSASQNKIEQESHVRFVVGLKVYLRKIDIRNGKIFTKRDSHGKALWPTRTSVTIAFDTKKPLNNIYTGLGLDIWPGCCINAGCILNKYSYNEYKSGQLFQNKNLYRAGFYLGISTDLSLFTEVGKFLNLSK
jgi:hypothetical protein